MKTIMILNLNGKWDSMYCDTEYWDKLERLRSLMSQRGFTEVARTAMGNRLDNVEFGYEKDRKPYPITCTIYNNSDKDFSFFYAVPGSINQLVTPKCGPYTDNKYFDRIFQKFFRQVQILEMNFR